MNLERIEAENITGTDQLDALIYLAEYAKVSQTVFWYSTCCSHAPPDAMTGHKSRLWQFVFTPDIPGMLTHLGTSKWHASAHRMATQ